MHAPGSDGITGELRTLRNRLDELERRNTQGPVCVNRLTGNLTFGVQNSQFPVTSWAAPLVDTHKMFNYNIGGATYWVLPFTGRYRISMVSIWQPFGGFDTARPPWVSQAIHVGAGSGPPEIATSVIPHLGSNDGSAPYSYNYLTNEERVYTANDIIRFQFFSRYGGTLVRKHPAVESYTHISITYVGSR